MGQQQTTSRLLLRMPIAIGRINGFGSGGGAGAGRKALTSGIGGASDTGEPEG
jgi:hypothetical protein